MNRNEGVAAAVAEVRDLITGSTNAATRKKHATFSKVFTLTYPVVFATPLDLLNGLARKPTDE